MLQIVLKCRSPEVSRLAGVSGVEETHFNILQHAAESHDRMIWCCQVDVSSCKQDEMLQIVLKWRSPDVSRLVFQGQRRHISTYCNTLLPS